MTSIYSKEAIFLSKFWAYYKDSNSDWQRIFIYEALHQRAIATGNTIRPSYYDSKQISSDNQVHVVRTSNDGRRIAHFAYQPGSKKSKQPVSKNTLLHSLYENAYSKQKYLILSENFENSRYPRPSKKVKIFFNNSIPEAHVHSNSTGEDYFIDLLIKLDRTEPASYYYKWNGRIALEVLNYHKVGYVKSNDLQDLKIQIFQIKIFSSMRNPGGQNLEQKYLQGLSDDKIREKIKIAEINILANINKFHKLVIGSFRNEVKPDNKHKEAFLELSNLENEINKAQNSLSDLQKQRNENNSILQKQYLKFENIKTQSKSSNEQLIKINEEIRNKQQLFESLNIDPETYKEDKKTIRNLNTTNKKLNNELKKIKNRTFFEKLKDAFS